MPAQCGHGLLVVDKPGGITSRDVVNRVQGWYPRGTKIGHAGTLDPLATGVLVLCLGAATRLTEYVQRMDKEYVTELELGARSDTDDADGTITRQLDASPPTRTVIDAALATFLGTVDQVPPDFSAARVDGQRAYKLARRQEPPQLAARPVRIDAIDVLHCEYPRLELRIRCGKGTYIRALARDLGNKLGCGAYVRTLQRTRIGPFTLQRAISLGDYARSHLPTLLPPAEALAPLPRLALTPEQARRLQLGQTISLDNQQQHAAREGETALYADIDLLGVGQVDLSQACVRPVKMLRLE